MEVTSDKVGLSRREARRNDRREAILAVAYASFLEHGYAATTMSGIAAKIGGSKATLWSYFPSKEALFEAVLDQATAAYRLQLSSLLDPCGDPHISHDRGSVDRGNTGDRWRSSSSRGLGVS